MPILSTDTQNIVRFNITGLPAAPPATDAIYITGDFNGWNPKDENNRLQKDANGLFFIQWKNINPGNYEFKFTRGSWHTCETDANGHELPNRQAAIQFGTAYNFAIESWNDGFNQKPKPSTASAQVTILDIDFPLPQLGRTRRIWVYLPKEYESSSKKYPVLYMHDGQNLFDDATAFAGEWGVDETMDTVANPCIVVGIDNGGVKRMNEYNPNNTKQFGKGEGKAYLSFIVDNLKPVIDKRYRTLTDKKHTYMAGSSMGGLISFYAGLYYPSTFSVLGVFSSSFWIAPQIKTQVKQLANKASHGVQKYYFYAGGEEDKTMVTNMKSVANELKKAANPQLVIDINPEGRHNEATWSIVFVGFYRWLNTMSDV